MRHLIPDLTMTSSLSFSSQKVLYGLYQSLYGSAASWTVNHDGHAINHVISFELVLFPLTFALPFPTKYIGACPVVHTTRKLAWWSVDLCLLEFHKGAFEFPYHEISNISGLRARNVSLWAALLSSFNKWPDTVPLNSNAANVSMYAKSWKTAVDTMPQIKVGLDPESRRKSSNQTFGIRRVLGTGLVSKSTQPALHLWTSTFHVPTKVNNLNSCKVSRIRDRILGVYVNHVICKSREEVSSSLLFIWGSSPKSLHLSPSTLSTFSQPHQPAAPSFNSSTKYLDSCICSFRILLAKWRTSSSHRLPFWYAHSSSKRSHHPYQLPGS